MTRRSKFVRRFGRKGRYRVVGLGRSWLFAKLFPAQAAVLERIDGARRCEQEWEDAVSDHLALPPLRRVLARFEDPRWQ